MEEGEPRLRLVSVEALTLAREAVLGRHEGDARAAVLLPFAVAADGGCLALDCRTGEIRDGVPEMPPVSWRRVAGNFSEWLEGIIANAEAYRTWHRRPRKAAEVVYSFSVSAFLDEQTDLESRRRFLLDLYDILRGTVESIGIDDDSPEDAESLSASVVDLGRGRWLRCPASEAVFRLMAAEPAPGHAVRFRDVALYGRPGSTCGASLYQHSWGLEAYLYLTAANLDALACRGWHPMERAEAASD